MKEAFVSPDLSVEIRDVDVPTPGPGQVLIKVIVSGSNPKDWKVPKFFLKDSAATDPGDDIAGIVQSTGDGVIGFSKGDRVAAFHEMMVPHGSFAEYALAWDYSTFHIPESTSFEEAATLPLCVMTAAVGLYQRLGLPLPWAPAAEVNPLVIYGGASAVGAFAIKLASLSNIHPIIAVAGRGAAYVETLIDRSKGDIIVDYREGNESVIANIRKALNGKPLLHSFDAVSEGDTYVNLAEVTSSAGLISTLLPVQVPNGIKGIWTKVGDIHNPKPPFTPPVARPNKDAEFAAALFQFVGRGLAQGWFAPHPHEIVPGGLGGLHQLLENLEKGKASANKYVIRIGDTEGITSAE